MNLWKKVKDEYNSADGVLHLLWVAPLFYILLALLIVCGLGACR